jgi:hypothetical protein
LSAIYADMPEHLESDDWTWTKLYDHLRLGHRQSAAELASGSLPDPYERHRTTPVTTRGRTS